MEDSNGFSLVRWTLAALLLLVCGCPTPAPEEGNEGQPCFDDGTCTPGLVCREGTCRKECTVDADCDDKNPCTDDSCGAAGCVRANNTRSCDDGKYCTGSDTCAGGVCAGSGDRCPGRKCDEAGKRCADCLADGDCGDNWSCRSAVSPKTSAGQRRR